MSTVLEAMKIPLSPPMTNIRTKASAWSMGSLNWIEPPQSVPSQLNVLIAEGIAMTRVVIMKGKDRKLVIPDDAGYTMTPEMLTLP